MELASRFADRVLLMEAGKLICDRKASDLWSDSTLLKDKHLPQPWAWRTRTHQQAPPCPIRTELQQYHLPLFLSSETLPILFVGGGKGIWRKAQGLIRASHPIKVMAPARL